MDSWYDVGGSDTWLKLVQTPGHFYHVWHSNKTKLEIFQGDSQWTYTGCFDWNSYGLKAVAIPKANRAVKAKAKAKAKAAKAKSRAKAKASVENNKHHEGIMYI